MPHCVPKVCGMLSPLADRQAPGLRKDKAFKIFVNPLAEKQRRVMEAKGKRINLDLQGSGDIEVCRSRMVALGSA